MLIPDFIKNAPDIVRQIEKHEHLFKPRIGELAHEGFLPGVKSQFATLHDYDMDRSLLQAIFDNSRFDDDVKSFFSFVQIQRYQPGDYIVWHKDTYNIVKLHLVTLTTSDTDGLLIVENGRIKKIYDLAGQYIDFPYDAPHAVEPVKNIRYSLVVGV